MNRQPSQESLQSTFSQKSTISAKDFGKKSSAAAGNQNASKKNWVNQHLLTFFFIEFQEIFELLNDSNLIHNSQVSVFKSRSFTCKFCCHWFASLSFSFKIQIVLVNVCFFIVMCCWSKKIIQNFFLFFLRVILVVFC